MACLISTCINKPGDNCGYFIGEPLYCYTSDESVKEWCL